MRKWGFAFLVLLMLAAVIVPLARADDCGVPNPDDCGCRKISKSAHPDICDKCSGSCYAKAKLAWCDNGR